jgi:hypothetical protein
MVLRKSQKGNQGSHEDGHGKGKHKKIGKLISNEVNQNDRGHPLVDYKIGKSKDLGYQQNKGKGDEADPKDKN